MPLAAVCGEGIASGFTELLQQFFELGDFGLEIANPLYELGHTDPGRGSTACVGLHLLDMCLDVHGSRRTGACTRRPCARACAAAAPRAASPCHARSEPSRASSTASALSAKVVQASAAGPQLSRGVWAPRSSITGRRRRTGPGRTDSSAELLCCRSAAAYLSTPRLEAFLAPAQEVPARAVRCARTCCTTPFVGSAMTGSRLTTSGCRHW